jgi:hypothetical protein
VSHPTAPGNGPLEDSLLDVQEYPTIRNTELKRQSAVLAAGWTMTWLALYIPALPINLLLKNHLHFGATAIASFNLFIGMAWNLKPIAGLVSDSFPLFGTRRRHYLLASSFIGGLSWLLVIVLPQRYSPLLWALIVTNTATMICSTVLGGLLVQVGKEHGASGRLSAHRTGIMNFTSLIAGPVGGFLAGMEFGWTAGICAGFLFCLVPIIWRYMNEPGTAVRNTAVLRQAGSQVKTIVRSKVLWCAVGMNVLLYIAPGFGTPLLFYQQGVLHLSDQYIGNLAFVSGALGTLGAILYMRVCRTLSLRVLMYAAVIGGGVGSLLYLGYSSKTMAILIEGGNGFLAAIGTLVIFDLSARAAPDGCEALSYSLMMAASNLSSQLSNIIGSWMYEKLHWPFMHLVWLNAGTTFLILIVVPFLPRVLMDRKDGEVA